MDRPVTKKVVDLYISQRRCVMHYFSHYFGASPFIFKFYRKQFKKLKTFIQAKIKLRSLLFYEIGFLCYETSEFLQIGLLRVEARPHQL